MNWQTELNSSLSWILTALFWVILCFSVVMIALKQTTFGQKFWHIASPSINRRNSIKIILMLLVLFTMILLEVRFSVLNSFFYNGLYSSMQELDADKFWFFAKLNALLVLVQVIHSIADYFLQQVFEIRWLESLNKVLVKRWLENKKYYQIIKVKRGKDFYNSDLEFLYGKELIKNKSENLKIYLESELKKYSIIIEKIKKESNTNSRISEINKLVESIRGILNGF